MGRRRVIQHSTTLKSNFRDGQQSGAYDCLARRKRWRFATPVIGAPRPLLHRPVSTTCRADFGTLPSARDPRGRGESGSAAWLAIGSLARYRGYLLLAVPAYIEITDLARGAAAAQFGGWRYASLSCPNRGSLAFLSLGRSKQVEEKPI